MELVGDRQGPNGGHSIVLVHGITESRQSWAPVSQLLAADFDVLRVDLRGHGQSALGPLPEGNAYDPMTMAADVLETCAAHDVVDPLLVGHSLGGVVVTAAAALASSVGVAVRGVINVDQPLRLAAFKEGLTQLEPLLRGSQDSFDQAIAMLFESMKGPLADDQRRRIGALRRGDPQVVLGVWGTVFESTADELDATVAALAGGVTVPYLSLHGIDPGDEYAAWLTGLVPSATVEVWADHGHYPHLVDTPRFIERVVAFDAGLPKAARRDRAQ